MAVKINHPVNGVNYLHHIWTQRTPTAEEQERLIALVNEDLVRQGKGNPPATVQNTHWCSGLPINHEFIYDLDSPQGRRYKIKLDRTGTNTIHLEVSLHERFQNICYGTLRYNYTAGSTNFKNELQPVSYNVEKTWAGGKTPPDGSVIGIELQGKVTRPVDPQPEDATETVTEIVPVDLAALGVTQKIQVTLNGGKEGGDDTAENPWKYTWSNLPPCDKDGNTITYSAKEVSYTIGGHTVNLRDFAPTEDTSTAGTTKLTNQIPEYSFEILKIDATTANTLEGAEFTLQAIEPTSNVSEPTKVGNPSSSDPAITGSDGKVSFNDISLGYYEVEEVHLPNGYNLTEDGKFYVRVDTDTVKLLEKVISDDPNEQPRLSFREVQPGAGGRIVLGNVELSKSGNTITFTVENTPGAALPRSS